MKKVAVVLFNLGGPDSKESIKPFLFNFFMDPNIIRLPLPFRYALAKLISIRRSKREAGASYGELGHKSPLLENTKAQAQALESMLNKSGAGNFKTFISMRYWHPMANETAKDVANWYPEHIVLLPLYPQFSTTTTWSSIGAWKKACAAINLREPTAAICCYPFNEGFINVSVDNIRAAYNTAKQNGHTPRILFSAHGLPKNIIDDGDPYQWQCEQSAHKIVTKLGIENLDWTICYQSRVGRLEWIGPSTEDEIRRAGAEKAPVLIYPHAFTQEHVETLVELDIEYKHVADEAGVPGYYRASCVSTHPAFIAGLAQMVCDNIGDERSSALKPIMEKVSAEGGKRLCPEEFSRCCMNKNI